MNLLFFSLVLSIQSGQIDTLNIEFVRDVIHVKSSERTFDFDVKINNVSNKSFLLYNLRTEPDQAFIDESFYCNKEIAARPSIIVFDEQMKPIYAHPKIPKDINYKPITDPMLKKLIETEKTKFRTALQVVPAGSSAIVSITGNLNELHLESGKYFIKLIYASGSNNLNMVSRDHVDEDQKKYKATMFQGCVKSDTVKLIVD
jgi:hypothetical protein